MDIFQQDKQLCSQCGGRCCQGHPGLWSDPERFFSIFSASQVPGPAELAALLNSHRLTLKNLAGVLIPAPGITEAGCAELRESGCRYSPQSRPCQCLALRPELETLLDDIIHCQLPAAYGSGTARENWRSYQDLLQQAQRILET